MNVTNVATNPVFIKKFNFYQPNLTVEFFGFSPSGPKTKADPPEPAIEQRQDQHEVRHV